MLTDLKKLAPQLRMHGRCQMFALRVRTLSRESASPTSKVANLKLAIRKQARVKQARPE